MDSTSIQELVTPEQASKPLAEWQLDLNTVIIIVMILGRVWKAWQDGGGWAGIWRSFMLGSAATPKQDVTIIKPLPDGINDDKRP